MSQNISHIFYINLDKRSDRREEIENQLQKYNLLDKAERFPAFYTPEQGALGCAQSHLAVIKLAKERKYPNVLILEDDFYFIISKEEFEHELKQFFDANIPFDVCMISYNIQRSHPTEYPFLQKIIEAQTASGYIVNESLYDNLIDIYEESIPLLQQTGEHWNYANDQIWKRLQPITKWYALTTRCGKQRPGLSDNSGQYQDHDC
jgi:glycosyl transferase family 25